MTRATTAVLFAVAAFVWSADAAAGQDDAEHLFERGKALMSDGKYDEACALLAKSQELDPADGTLLALGLCHEHQGRFVAAHEELRVVLANATTSGREDRQRVANAALRRVTSRVARILVRLEDPHDPGDVRRDGHAVPPASLDREVAVEPGQHVVDLRRGNRVVWEKTVDLAAGGASVVVVPRSASAPAPAPAPTPAPLVAAPIAPSRTASVSPLALVLGGASVAALATGTIFGIRAFSSWSDVRARCPTLECADPGARSDASSASRSALVADVLVIAGVVLAGVATYVFLSHPRDARSAQIAVPPR
jgi:hypothetical protein